MTTNPANEQTPANTPDIDISILHQPWEDEDFDIARIIERVVAETLYRADLPETAAYKKVEISFALVSDDVIRQLNKEFRNKDTPTNVLSFAFEGGETLPAESTEYPLGDIVMAHETVVREAKEQNKSLIDHCTHMILHGLLHLLGYDHIEDDEAEIMETKEIEILEKIGIENPYL